jgi:hypothetical protein
MKKFNDSIGNRTRNLPVCSAVPTSTSTNSTTNSNGKINYSAKINILFSKIQHSITFRSPTLSHILQNPLHFHFVYNAYLSGYPVLLRTLCRRHPRIVSCGIRSTDPRVFFHSHFSIESVLLEMYFFLS